MYLHTLLSSWWLGALGMTIRKLGLGEWCLGGGVALLEAFRALGVGDGDMTSCPGEEGELTSAGEDSWYPLLISNILLGG